MHRAAHAVTVWLEERFDLLQIVKLVQAVQIFCFFRQSAKRCVQALVHCDYHTVAGGRHGKEGHLMAVDALAFVQCRGRERQAFLCEGCRLSVIFQRKLRHHFLKCNFAVHYFCSSLMRSRR